jgi:hypothetical protein
MSECTLKAGVSYMQDCRPAPKRQRRDVSPEQPPLIPELSDLVIGFLSNPVEALELADLWGQDLIGAYCSCSGERVVEIEISSDGDFPLLAKKVKGVTCLRVSVAGNIKKFPAKFLKGCKSLKMVEFLAAGVEAVGNDWLSGCNELVAVSFRDVGSLRSVGDRWMKSCTKLKRCSFAGLGSLEKVGNGWLEGCKALEYFSGKGLKSLQNVGKKWLADCKRLASFDGGGMFRLESVGDDWLSGCPKLVVLECADLKALKDKGVGRQWLQGCKAPPKLNGRDMSEVSVGSVQDVPSALHGFVGDGLVTFDSLGSDWLQSLGKNGSERVDSGFPSIDSFES